MFTIILGLIFLSFTVSARAQTNDVPVLKPVSINVNVGGPFSFHFSGIPQQVDATLTDASGVRLPFRAVLRASGSDGQRLDFESPAATESGTFRINVSAGNTSLTDTTFTIGNSSEVKSAVSRSASTVITPDKTYETVIEYTAKQDGPVEINEFVPLNALVDAPEASASVKPELLNLRFPFESDYEMSEPFGYVNPEEHFGISLHDGIDYALPHGVPIHAVDDGEIVPYREKNSYGITAAIQHTWGRTFYGHLSTASAQLGTKVRKGDIVGLSGNTGLSTGPHLHFGMMLNEEMVDAAKYMTRENDNTAATKQLTWLLDLKKGQTAAVKYKYSLPAEYTSYESLPFGPATVSTPENAILEQESSPLTAIVADEDPDMQKIASDPSFNGSSAVTLRDGVILWIDAHDDRILHGFDKVTQTTFTQTVNHDEDTTLTIDDKNYLLDVSERAITLSLK